MLDLERSNKSQVKSTYFAWSGKQCVGLESRMRDSVKSKAYRKEGSAPHGPCLVPQPLAFYARLQCFSPQQNLECEIQVNKVFYHLSAALKE